MVSDDEVKMEESLLGVENGGSPSLVTLADDSGAFRLVRGGKQVAIHLTETTLEFWNARVVEGDAPRNVIDLVDVVGATGEEGVLDVLWYPRMDPNCCSRDGARQSKQIAWRVADESKALEWARAIRGHVGAGANDRRNLLVFVNPASGTRAAPKLWAKYVGPTLRRAGLSHTVVETAYAGHAGEMVSGSDAGASLNLGTFTDLVVVGGDGLLHEVLQGIHARGDCAAQLRRLRFGVVPAGTGNGLAKTLLDESGEAYGPLGACYLIARGASRPFDLTRVQTAGRTRLGFLQVGWAIISDVDVESERFRWLGSARITVYALLRIAALRFYPGRLSFLPCQEDHPEGGAAGDAQQMPSLDQPLPSDGTWQTIEGDFCAFTAVSCRWMAHDMQISPGAGLSDGVMYIFALRRGTTKAQVLQMFLDMERGAHIKRRVLEVYRVKAYRLEPLTDRGILTVDGEVVEYGAVQSSVWPKATNVICSSI